MGSFYHLDTEHELALFRATGRFTESDLVELLRSVYEDPCHTPTFDHVWDSRGIEKLVVDADVIGMYRDLLDEYEGQISRGKVAVVAVRTLTRTFTSMLIGVGANHPATFQVFPDMEAAAAWIGVPPSATTDVPDHGWTEV